MNQSSQDAGVIQALLERLNNQRLPRALELQRRVNEGERLTDYDMRFLEEVLADARKARPMLERHPEYQDLAARLVQLYKEITEKAVENEKKA